MFDKVVENILCGIDDAKRLAEANTGWLGLLTAVIILGAAARRSWPRVRTAAGWVRARFRRKKRSPLAAEILGLMNPKFLGMMNVTTNAVACNDGGLCILDRGDETSIHFHGINALPHLSSYETGLILEATRAVREVAETKARERQQLKKTAEAVADYMSNPDVELAQEMNLVSFPADADEIDLVADAEAVPPAKNPYHWSRPTPQ